MKTAIFRAVESLERKLSFGRQLAQLTYISTHLALFLDYTYLHSARMIAGKT